MREKDTLPKIITELRFMERVDNFNGVSGYLDDLEAHAKIYEDMLAALKGFDLTGDMIISGTADSLTLRVPLSVLQAAAATVDRATK